AVGYGDIHPHQIAMRISTEMRPPHDQEMPALRPASVPSTSAIRVLGVGDLLTRLAQCCNPVPGDDIIGYITRGKGVTVHRQACPSVVKEQDQERVRDRRWR